VIPSKIFEAMAMGIPLLLAAPEGEASSIVTQLQVGITVPPENPAALADAVRKLVEGNGLIRQIGNRGVSAVQKFSRDKQARAMLEVMAAAIDAQKLCPPKGAATAAGR